MSRPVAFADDLAALIRAAIALSGAEAVEAELRRQTKGRRGRKADTEAAELVWLLVELTKARRQRITAIRDICRKLCERKPDSPPNDADPVGLTVTARGVVATTAGADPERIRTIHRRVDRMVQRDPQHPLRQKLAQLLAATYKPGQNPL